MKISKKGTKVAESKNISASSQGACSYEECIGHIRAAIDCLAECASDDPLARDAIADLSVVLFELK